MKTDEMTKIEKNYYQLRSLHEDFERLSKKNPDGPLNGFKVDLINKILIGSNELLKDKYKPFDGFEVFDSAKLPTNSDVLLIVGQYIKSLEKYYEDCVSEAPFGGTWHWIIDGKVSGIEAKSPQSLRNL